MGDKGEARRAIDEGLRAAEARVSELVNMLTKIRGSIDNHDRDGLAYGTMWAEEEAEKLLREVQTLCARIRVSFRVSNPRQA